MNNKEDKYYIEQVLAGSTNAFSFIVERHKDKAYNLAFRICCNREEAEEIAQDSFLKAYRSLSGFKMKSSFATWLYRIVYNNAITLVRTRKKGILYIEDFPADFIDFTGNNISEEESEKEFIKSIVNFALQKISDEERGLISLYYYDDMSIEEISGITGISKSNVKIKLFRARHKMSDIIEKIEKKKLIYHE